MLSVAFTDKKVLTSAMLNSITQSWTVTDSGFGATGDGVTDDTAAIQAALTAANDAGGGLVVFPKPAVSYVHGALTLYSGVRLMYHHTGSPEGTLYGQNGDIVWRLDGGSPLYYKTGGASTTGWVELITSNVLPLGTDVDSILTWSGSNWTENVTFQVGSNVATLGSDAAAAANFVTRKAEGGSINWSMYSNSFERMRHALTSGENYQWSTYGPTGSLVATPLQLITGTGELRLGVFNTPSVRMWTHLYPSAGSTWNIGGVGLTFAEGHFDNLFLGGTQLAQLADGTVEGSTTYWDNTGGVWAEETQILRTAAGVLQLGDGSDTFRLRGSKADGSAAFPLDLHSNGFRRWLLQFDTAETLLLSRYDAAGVFQDVSWQIDADGDWTFGTIGGAIEAQARNVFIGRNTDTADQQLIINSPDAHQAQLHFRDAGTNRYSEHLANNGDSMMFYARGSDGLVDFTTTYSLTSGRWTFPADVYIQGNVFDMAAVATPFGYIGDGTGQPQWHYRKDNVQGGYVYYMHGTTVNADGNFRTLHTSANVFGLQAYFSAMWNDVWSVAAASDTVTFHGDVVIGGVTQTAGLADGTQVGALNYWSGSAWVEETTIRREAANTLRVGVSSGVIRVGDNSDTITYSAGTLSLVRGGGNSVSLASNIFRPDSATITLGGPSNRWIDVYGVTGNFSTDVLIPTPTTVAINVGGTARPPAGATGIRYTLTDAQDFYPLVLRNNAGQAVWSWRRVGTSLDYELRRSLAGVLQGYVIYAENADPGHLWLGDADAGAETRVRSRLYVTDTAPTAGGAQFGVNAAGAAVSYQQGTVSSSQKIGGHSDVFPTAVAGSGETVSWSLSTQDGTRLMRSAFYMTDDAVEANRAFGIHHSWAAGGSASFVVGSTTNEWQRFDPGGDAYFPNHRLAIGTAAFEESTTVLEAFGASGDLMVASSRTDGVDKTLRLTMPNLDNATVQEYVLLEASSVNDSESEVASFSVGGNFNSWQLRTNGVDRIQVTDLTLTPAASGYGLGDSSGSTWEAVYVTDFVHVIEMASTPATDAFAGRFWVENTSPNIPKFTDGDSGVHTLAYLDPGNITLPSAGTAGSSLAYVGGAWATQANVLINSTAALDLYLSDASAQFYMGNGSGSPFQFMRKSTAGSAHIYFGDNASTVSDTRHKRITHDANQDLLIQDHDGTGWRDMLYLAEDRIEIAFGTGGSAWRFDVNELLSSVDGARLSVGLGLGTTDDANSVIEAVGGQGMIIAANSIVNGTDKEGSFSVFHDAITEESLTVVHGLSNGTDNIVSVGGGYANGNAATEVRIRAAANDTTLTGTTVLALTTTDILPLDGVAFGDSTHGVSEVHYQETGTAPTTAAGGGATWDQNSTPSTHMYTDDAGNDHPMSLMPDIELNIDSAVMDRTTYGTFETVPTGVVSGATAPSYSEEAVSNIHYLVFDAANSDVCFWVRTLPASYAGGGLTLEIRWGASGSNTGNVLWEAAFMSLASGEDMGSQVYASPQQTTSAGNGTSDSIVVATIDFTDAEIDGLSPGEAFAVYLHRNGGAGGDTQTGNAQVYHCRIYETNTLAAAA